jgi:cytidyltransferase-like protein
MRVHVINGRFQPFHLGHLRYAREASKGCDLLIAGLTRSFPVEASTERDPIREAAPHRFDDHHNPLTFAERAAVVQLSLDRDPHVECPVALSAFPIERPDILRTYIPTSWTMVTTRHEPWNDRKISLLRDVGYSVVIVCEGEPKYINGSVIRDSLRKGDDRWRSMVTEIGAHLIDSFRLADRLARDHNHD